MSVGEMTTLAYNAFLLFQTTCKTLLLVDNAVVKLTLKMPQCCKGHKCNMFFACKGRNYELCFSNHLAKGQNSSFPLPSL